MTVEHRIGDLFNQPDVAALGHGVNCRGVMGSGIAPLFARRWPDMEKAYIRQCKSGALTLGKVFPWTDPVTGLVIYNLASQDRPGRNAVLDAVRTCLAKMINHAEDRELDSIAIPRIGAGIGGLRWQDVSAAIDEVGSPTSVRLVVVSLPNADSALTKVKNTLLR